MTLLKWIGTSFWRQVDGMQTRSFDFSHRMVELVIYLEFEISFTNLLCLSFFSYDATYNGNADDNAFFLFHHTILDLQQ